MRGAKKVAKEVSRSGLTPYLTRKLRALGRVVVNRTYRYELVARLGIAKGAFQPYSTTSEGRYPEIFNYVQSALGLTSDVRILSFGCSTGEEVFTLRTYFPHAQIKGVDINPGNIALCRRRLAASPDPGLIFEVAKSTQREPSCTYDAIFCMAVLRHGGLAGPGTTRCDHLIRFEDFSRVIVDFERCLKPGGLLAVRHSNFFVAHTRAAADFDAALILPMSPGSPVFGPDNRLIEGACNHEAVFCKRR